MARTTHRLTDSKVRAANAVGYHADGSGLYLQISKAGTKSWIFRFALKGRSREMGLGSLKQVPLVEARKLASEARLLRDSGIDPLAERDCQREAERTTKVADEPVKFREFAEQYIDGLEADWKNEKHRKQWRATLEAYAYPIIGDMTIDAIETKHILEIIEPHWRTKSETMGRVRGRVERILAAASVKGLRNGNPAQWRGHLKEAGLGKRRKTEHFKAMPYVEIPAFLAELRGRKATAALALEFLILSAARSAEVLGARWSEVDREARTWTMPAERTKQGREHIVPLCDRALKILDEVAPLRDLGAGYVFPGQKRGKPLSAMALAKMMDCMAREETVHGFRSTFRDWAGDCTTYPQEIAEAALAHAIRDKTEASYRRSSALEKRRLLMNEWAKFCTTRPASTVVSLPQPIPATAG